MCQLQYQFGDIHLDNIHSRSKTMSGLSYNNSMILRSLMGRENIAVEQPSNVLLSHTLPYTGECVFAQVKVTSAKTSGDDIVD